VLSRVNVIGRWCAILQLNAVVTSHLKESGGRGCSLLIAYWSEAVCADGIVHAPTQMLQKVFACGSQLVRHPAESCVGPLVESWPRCMSLKWPLSWPNTQPRLAADLGEFGRNNRLARGKRATGNNGQVGTSPSVAFHRGTSYGFRPCAVIFPFGGTDALPVLSGCRMPAVFLGLQSVCAACERVSSCDRLPDPGPAPRTRAMWFVQLKPCEIRPIHWPSWCRCDLSLFFHLGVLLPGRIGVRKSQFSPY
jgi:hypothetical protein